MSWGALDLATIQLQNPRKSHLGEPRDQATLNSKGINQKLGEQGWLPLIHEIREFRQNYFNCYSLL